MSYVVCIVLHKHPQQFSQIPQIVNSFALIPIEAVIPEFLEWMKTQTSESYFRKTIMAYVKYLALLASPLKISQLINVKSAWTRTHMMKVISNFQSFSM